MPEEKPGTKAKLQEVYRGFIMGLAEFGSFGARAPDFAGYPHESEEDAIYSDWQTMGNDMRRVIKECRPETPMTNQGERQWMTSKEAQ